MRLASTIDLYAGGEGSGPTAPCPQCGPKGGGKIPPVFNTLATEARKAATFQEFEDYFLRDIHHGRYYQVVNHPDFQKLDLKKFYDSVHNG